MIVRNLGDGLSVWLDPMRDVRSVALGVYVDGGSADEASERLGATHFLEHLLFKRTRRRSGAAIARMTDRLGGDCDAYTTKEYVAFHGRAPADRLPEALDLLLDLTEAPVFTREDVELERGVILEEMAEAHDDPLDRLHDEVVRALWPDHPLGAPIFGTKESVAGLTHRALVARFHEIFQPGRTLIVAAGAFDPDRFVDRLERARRLRRGGRAKEAGARETSPAPRDVRCAVHLERNDLNQTHVLIGAQTIPFRHPLVPAASVAATVLGGGVSSRLWRAVRERSGLAYQVGAGLTFHRAAGVIVVEASTAPENLGRLLRTTGKVLSGVLKDGVTRAELDRAKNQLVAEAALSVESTVSRRERAARAFLYRGRPYEDEEYLADLRKVTVDDVAAALRLMLGTGRAGLGVAGPALAKTSVDDLLTDLRQRIAA